MPAKAAVSSRRLLESTGGISGVVAVPAEVYRRAIGSVIMAGPPPGGEPGVGPAREGTPLPGPGCQASASLTCSPAPRAGVIRLPLDPLDQAREQAGRRDEAVTIRVSSERR